NKHSNWTVLSQSLHSKIQSWTLLLTVVAALYDVLFARRCTTQQKRNSSLSTGPSPTSWTATRTPPLHWTAFKDNSECVRALLESGAGPNAHDYNNDTPLSWAAMMGNLETVRVLLEYGAQIHVTDLKGQMPVSRLVALLARGPGGGARGGVSGGWGRQGVLRAARPTVPCPGSSVRIPSSLFVIPLHILLCCSLTCFFSYHPFTHYPVMGSLVAQRSKALQLNA
uniref:Uncharacterized protein n=1 Tax=Salmo trutta TaxID=8032 RepID=A0A673X2W2_SALTR